MENGIHFKFPTFWNNDLISNDNREGFELSEVNNPLIEVIHENLSDENFQDMSFQSCLNSVNLSSENLEDTNFNLEQNSGNSVGLFRNGRKKDTRTLSGLLKHHLKHIRECQTGNGQSLKSVVWTRQEHQMFLVGLHSCGKGEWTSIARAFVTTRTPAQVASHAQKYFTRLAASEAQKIRASVFDAPLQLHQPAASIEQMVLHGIGEQSNIAGSFIPAMPFPCGPMTTTFPYHPGYQYQHWVCARGRQTHGPQTRRSQTRGRQTRGPQTRGPSPGSSSAAMDQPPEAAQICSSPPATTVDLELRLGL